MMISGEIENESIVSNNGDSNHMAQSSRYTSLLCCEGRDYLLSPSQTQVKISELEGQVLGLYFSANWYPPCRNFNQCLSNVYEQLKTNGSNFEIVFVSADEDSDAFNNYHSTMPWLAIPFSDIESRKSLSQKFDVEGIPCLIILQPNDGNSNEVGTDLRDGVELVYRYGIRAFPFTKDRLQELQMEEKERQDNQTLVGLLTNHDRDYLLGHPNSRQVPVSSLEGKTIGLFFSAEWCLPGVKFTPKLISIYEKIKEMLASNENEDFEIVYVSSDRTQSSFNSYFALMPWLALPFGDQNMRELLKHFDVQGIPCVVILGPDGKTVTKHGRSLINLYQESAYPFTAEKLELLQKQMDEEAKSLPKSEFHEGHRHELMLVSNGSGGGPYICCDCDEQGYGWAYQCLECGYEVHPKCVRAVHGNMNF